VLTRAAAEEQRLIDATVVAGADAIEQMLGDGAQKAMQKLHARPAPPASEN
jgi:peptidyl-tRNA hydrolase